MVQGMALLRRVTYKVLLGSGFIASGWGWYHLSKHNIPMLVASIIGIAAGVAIVFVIGSAGLSWLVRRFDRHIFWQNVIREQLDDLFFVMSLLFVIFFFRNELVSVVYLLAWIPLVFWYIHRMLADHPHREVWQHVHRIVGLVVWGVCAFQAAVQLTAYHYYILDSNIKFFNIVLFRAVAVVQVLQNLKPKLKNWQVCLFVSISKRLSVLNLTPNWSPRTSLVNWNVVSTFVALSR
jgi:hypothetical protein